MAALNLSKPASGCLSCPIDKPLRIRVFFPISTTADPRSSPRIRKGLSIGHERHPDAGLDKLRG